MNGSPWLGRLKGRLHSPTGASGTRPRSSRRTWEPAARVEPGAEARAEGKADHRRRSRRQDPAQGEADRLVDDGRPDRDAVHRRGGDLRDPMRASTVLSSRRSIGSVSRFTIESRCPRPRSGRSRGRRVAPHVVARLDQEAERPIAVPGRSGGRRTRGRRRRAARTTVMSPRGPRRRGVGRGGGRRAGGRAVSAGGRMAGVCALPSRALRASYRNDRQPAGTVSSSAWTIRTLAGTSTQVAGAAAGAAFLEALRTTLPDLRLSVDPTDLEAHRRDETAYIEPPPPLAVAFPASTDEVAGIVRLAAAHRVPLVPAGARARASRAGRSPSPAGSPSRSCG